MAARREQGEAKLGKQKGDEEAGGGGAREAGERREEEEHGREEGWPADEWRKENDVAMAGRGRR